jgi:hypothetical protein
VEARLDICHKQDLNGEKASNMQLSCGLLLGQLCSTTCYLKARLDICSNISMM